jgi:hypothetical protein
LDPNSGHIVNVKTAESITIRLVSTIRLSVALCAKKWRDQEICHSTLTRNTLP